MGLKKSSRADGRSCECSSIGCQACSGQGRGTALEGFGKFCPLVIGPGNETFPSQSLETSQSCHLLGSLALFSILQAGSALLPSGPLATPTAVSLHLEPGGSVGTASRGDWNSTAVFLAFSERAAVLRLRQGWDGMG